MTSAAPEEAPPKLYEHCLTVFGQMKKEAKATTIEDEHALVYEGFLTRLFNQLELATPYYTSVMQRLRKMGCVRQLSRGGGAAPSKWLLVDDPTWELFDGSENKLLRDNTWKGQVNGQLLALQDRIQALEDIFESMLDQEKAS
jgi:hypothetical protein